jgi:hypothetical protein
VLANSEDLLELVEKYSGKVLPSFMTSFVYYDEEGRSSPPHVDNAFTAITVMLMLKHEVPTYVIQKSRSVVYWSNKERFDYVLDEGEISIFFGVSALHGRTPVSHGEKVYSILFSFRPKELFN